MGFSFSHLHAAHNAVPHLTQPTSMSYSGGSSRSYSHSLLDRQSFRTVQTYQSKSFLISCIGLSIIGGLSPTNQGRNPCQMNRWLNCCKAVP
jgi:hypothetical protein